MAELCRREGIHPTVYYHWLKDFMEAGKARMRVNMCLLGVSRSNNDCRKWYATAYRRSNSDFGDTEDEVSALLQRVSMVREVR